MLNLSVTVSVKDAGLPFICVIKGSKRKQHRFDNEYIEHEIKYSGPGTLVIEMSIDHMTGKLVNEA